MTTKEYYHAVKKFKPRPSRRQDTSVRCFFCSILLVSKFGGKLRRKYCDDCARHPKVRRRVLALYARRAYQKRNGLPVDSLDDL